MRRRLDKRLAALATALGGASWRPSPAARARATTCSSRCRSGRPAGTASSRRSGRASADGTRVLLRTVEPLVATDTDAEFDLYERTATGVTTQLSTRAGRRQPAGGRRVRRGASADGSRVFFETLEPLVASDTDDCELADREPNPCTDVYQYANGSTSLVSAAGTAPSTRSTGARPRTGRASSSRRAEQFSARTPTACGTSTARGRRDHAGVNGRRGWQRRLRPDYRGARPTARVCSSRPRSNWSRPTPTTRATSTSARVARPRCCPPGRRAGTAGTTLVPGRLERRHAACSSRPRSSSSRRTPTTRSTSTSAPAARPRCSPPGRRAVTAPSDALFEALSADGTRVFFQTAEQLVGSDTDSTLDVYERAGGATTLLSTGPAGGTAPSTRSFQDVSDGRLRVVFGTAEALVAADTDGRIDLYERAGGSTTLCRPGPGGNGSFDAFFSAASRTAAASSSRPPSSCRGPRPVPDVYERGRARRRGCRSAPAVATARRPPFSRGPRTTAHACGSRRRRSSRPRTRTSAPTSSRCARPRRTRGPRARLR